MMYMHYCKNCQHIHILNGHKPACPKCGCKLTELSISYKEYSDLSVHERKCLLDECKSTPTLSKLQTTYRMYKYSKWYKNLQR